MRALVTGGAGFIGSHLTDELLRRGHSVHVLDDLSTGSEDNLRHLRDEARFKCTIGSSADPRVAAYLVDEADVIYHLAAAVGVGLVVESPVSTIGTNLDCTQVVLAQAGRDGKPVLLASTSEVYGKSTDLPLREDGDLVLGAPATGRWSYACSKAADEFLALAYWRERGLPTVIARLFNTIGPRQLGHHGMVVPRFVEAALAGRDLEVHGGGSQSRCFCDVRDVVGALADLATHDECHGGVFNVGGTEEITILELAERVIALTESSSRARSVPYEEVWGPGFADIERRRPDISKITTALGWRPTRTLDDTLADVIVFERLGRAEPGGPIGETSPPHRPRTTGTAAARPSAEPARCAGRHLPSPRRRAG